MLNGGQIRPGLNVLTDIWPGSVSMDLKRP